MPNCFTLTRKSELEKGPVPLVKIDEEMCKHFNITPHPKFWHQGWHDDIGFGLACGKSFQRQREIATYDLLFVHTDNVARCYCGSTEDRVKWIKHQLEIIDWLDANFTSDNWVEIGKYR